MALGGVNDITPLLLHTYKKRKKNTHCFYLFSEIWPICCFFGQVSWIQSWLHWRWRVKRSNLNWSNLLFHDQGSGFSPVAGAHPLNPFIFCTPYFSPSLLDHTFGSSQKHDFTPFCCNPPSSSCFLSSIHRSWPELFSSFVFLIQSSSWPLCFPALLLIH